MPSGVGDLADEIDPEVEGEGGPVLLQVVVEADLAGLVAEEDGWAELVFGEGLGFEDVLVAEAAENVVFAFGHPMHLPRIDLRLARGGRSCLYEPCPILRRDPRTTPGPRCQ